MFSWHFYLELLLSAPIVELRSKSSWHWLFFSTKSSWHWLFFSTKSRETGSFFTKSRENGSFFYKISSWHLPFFLQTPRDTVSFCHVSPDALFFSNVNTKRVTGVEVSYSIFLSISRSAMNEFQVHYFDTYFVQYQNCTVLADIGTGNS